MINTRLASLIAALAAIVMLSGCAKTNEAASPGAEPAAAGDAAPEGEPSSTEVVPDEPAAATSENEAPPKN